MYLEEALTKLDSIGNAACNFDADDGVVPLRSGLCRGVTERAEGREKMSAS